MNELKNKSKNPAPLFFYRVAEKATNFRLNKNLIKSHQRDKIFTGESLEVCRIEALKYYFKKEAGLLNYINRWKHWSYSVTLSLIESHEEDHYEYYLAGEDEFTIAEGREAERVILGMQGVDTQTLDYA
jgi:hypothetical protein